MTAVTTAFCHQLYCSLSEGTEKKMIVGWAPTKRLVFERDSHTSNSVNCHLGSAVMQTGLRPALVSSVTWDCSGDLVSFAFLPCEVTRFIPKISEHK